MSRVSKEPRSIACTIEAPEAYVPRARYALHMLLLPLGLTPRWVNREGLAGDTPGIYYGAADRPTGPNTLAIDLHTSTIEYFDRRTEYPVERVRWRKIDGRNVPVLFPLRGNRFDVVASTFFWLSGWQEYTIRTRDRHGRFPYDASLQHHWNVIEQPVVDIYRLWLKDHLNSVNVTVQDRTWGRASWAVCPTHDIDYLRKWRPGLIYRELVEYLLQNRLQQPPDRRWNRLLEVAATARGGRDPYRYSWEQMHREERRHGVGATYFVKTGAHGAYDVDGSSSRKYLEQRIDNLLASGFEIGLHPSYHAATHSGYMEREVTALEELTGRPVRTVRQHYLRYQHPLTMRMQVSAGFDVDTSMGFAAHEGFRHGTCMPFQYFDIYENRPSELWMFPLALMDSTLFGYRNLTPEKAVERTRQLVDTCEAFGGVCVLLWHNIIYDPVDGHGYDRHFETILEEVASRNAFTGSISEAFDRWKNS